ncbi:hypothetical protein [Flavobacterium columnare]|uniref:Uncharacterized protein n=1 Tax=Flavobacterium columnare TaxID=996 RepID=A0AA94F0B6_9FLAO|nr:hypothetical protein [Flavobacterium columnare]MCH4829248.1 hypothetical protein [Flavobacterium columnare]MCH4834024.1 hypothetical protein [Flavobacterium columnare]
MTEEILKKLFYSFIWSFAISIVFSWLNYQATEGFEAKQADFILVVLTFFLCLLNFISSLTALLNLYKKIRESLVLSAISFFGIPLLILMDLLIQYLAHRNSSDTFLSFILLSIPSISYIVALAFNFIKFRKDFELN